MPSTSSPQSTASLDSLLNERDVARIVGVSVDSVQRWRRHRQGPRFLKVGAGRQAAVRYQKSDLLFWLASRPSGGEETGRDQLSNLTPGTAGEAA